VILRGVATKGLSGLADTRLEGLDRVVRATGSPRCRRALSDALMLGFGALDPLAGARALGWMRIAAKLDDGHWVMTWPDQLHGLLAPGPTNTVSVSLDLELDPPQFGQLRQHAVHDPDLVSALGNARLRLTTGWAFTPNLTLGSPAILSARLGDHHLDREKKSWVVPWLVSLASRLHAHTPRPPNVELWAQAQRSPDPARRSAYQRAIQALKRPPFSIGELRVVETGGKRWLVGGEELLPLTRLGPLVCNAVALVESVFLDDADILVVEEPCALTEHPRALLNWLARQATEPDSPLEQVLLLSGSGDLQLSPPSLDPALTL